LENSIKSNNEPHLKRVLGLWDLIIYGMVLMQLVAPVPIYGLIQLRSHGNALPTILFAMVAMIFTALSYGRMTFLFPMAGSAYTYVARGINPHLGFLVGWAMVLDYLIVPLVSIIIPALVLQHLLPGVPFPALTLIIILAMTFLNLGGMKATTRANSMLLIITGAAVMIFIVMAIRYLYLKSGWEGVLSITPIYDPKTFSFNYILTGTSLAALTYIGFDEVTTLAEDTINPKKNIVIATVLICLITGLVSSIELYLFQMVWPDWTSFKNLDTAYLDIMKLVGGALLFGIFSLIMSISQFGSGLSGQVGAARLLYGMGRDNVLPKKIFGYLSSKSRNPIYNIFIVGVIAFTGSIFLQLERACDLLNFGAFLGYMGVNLSVIWSYFIHPPKDYKRLLFKDLILPSVGFVFCFAIWLELPQVSKITGAVWLIIGIIYSAIKTNWFRNRPILFNFNTDVHDKIF
jgi:putrescine importer